jgi:hypothetical protein
VAAHVQGDLVRKNCVVRRVENLRVSVFVVVPDYDVVGERRAAGDDDGTPDKFDGLLRGEAVPPPGIGGELVGERELSARVT